MNQQKTEKKMEQQLRWNGEKVQILHIDDHFGLAKALDNEIKNENNFDFFNAHDEEEAISILKKNNKISLVILDLDLKGKSGLDLIPALKNENPDLKILVYSAFTEAIHIEESKKCGVQGYVSKDLDLGELIKAIYSLLNGEEYFPKESNDENDESTYFKIYKSLTSREKEIFTYIVQFKTTKEIAEILGKSEKTISNQKLTIFGKFFVNNTLNLLKCAKILGMV